MENYLFLETTISTNSALGALLDKQPEEGFILQAGYQTKGRGQGTNGWESEASKNLLFSMVLYPDFLSPVTQFLLSKTIALAIVNVLNGYETGFQIKWPNDIYYSNKKLGGILIETAIMGTTLKHAIFGIGINVNQVAFQNLPNPISLKQILGADLEIPLLLSQIKQSIFMQYDLLRQGPTEIISQQYAENMYRKNGIWKFKDTNGVFEAQINKVEDSGRLLLQTPEKAVRSYWMKEVEFII